LPVARELGIDVPGELMVAASSDFGLGATADPPMTTLDYNTATLAREATRLLVQLVRGETPAERQKLVPVKLVERESTAR
jgi:DNA-binding LacI/PurR family transcriptional regulator